MSSSSSSIGYIINGDKNDIAPNEPIRLRECSGIDGLLEELVDGPEGLIIATIVGVKVELPCILKKKLEPLIGQEVRVGFLCGKYHACKMVRRPANEWI